MLIIRANNGYRFTCFLPCVSVKEKAHIMETLMEVIGKVAEFIGKGKWTPPEFFGMIVGMAILTPPFSWVCDKVMETINKLKIRKNGSTKY